MRLNQFQDHAVTLDVGVKYLFFVSSRSLKTREPGFAQFVYFLREVSLFFNFQKLKSNTLPSKNVQTEQH